MHCVGGRYSTVNDLGGRKAIRDSQQEKKKKQKQLRMQMRSGLKFLTIGHAHPASFHEGCIREGVESGRIIDRGQMLFGGRTQEGNVCKLKKTGAYG